MTTANKLSAPKLRPRPRSKAWLERQRKFYDLMHSDDGSFEFIEFEKPFELILRTLFQ